MLSVLGPPLGTDIGVYRVGLLYAEGVLWQPLG